MVFLNFIISIFCCLIVISIKSFLGPFNTFIFLDIILSIFLVSIFNHSLKFLFLLHPIIVFFSSYGFQIPFPQIGVGYTYVNTFDLYVDPSNMNFNIDLLKESLFFSTVGNSIFGIGSVYIGTIPILYLPQLLFDKYPSIIIYLSLSLFTIIYSSISAIIAINLCVIKEKIILAILLFATISPTFFEMNSSLHRYGLLFFGLFLFLISYYDLSRVNTSIKNLRSVFLLFFALIIILVSKAALALSLLLFIFLDMYTLDKIPLLGFIKTRFDMILKSIFYLLILAIIYLCLAYIIPEKYFSIISQKGGQFQSLTNLPILGFIVRLIYAVLSPFPWFGFSQFHIYGNNYIFLPLHILSSLGATWIIISIIFNLKSIMMSSDQIRVPFLFGISIIASLSFSSVGYHVYLAPALPFLVVIMFINKVSFIYSIIFCSSMEIAAQLARILR